MKSSKLIAFAGKLKLFKIKGQHAQSERESNLKAEKPKVQVVGEEGGGGWWLGWERMKVSTKPMSSPGRTEKFPPPLMRFLRSNVGSRSRGRTRSSPMFIRRRSTAIETQEPSSPKVTCIGQVRVRRSSNRRRRKTSAGRRFRWIRSALLCNNFPRKLKPKSPRIVWPKWLVFFQLGFRRKPEAAQDSSRIESKFAGRIANSEGEEEQEGDDDEEEEEEATKVFVYPNSSSSSPPKNALLLTRCRSAPYRSSSLAGRFWSSPLTTRDAIEEQRPESENRAKYTEIERPSSRRESIPELEPRRGSSESEEKLRFFKELEASIRERFTQSATTQKSKSGEEAEDDGGLGGSARPLILTRCKSEPARKTEKLNPDMSFWKKRRLGVSDSWLSGNV